MINWIKSLFKEDKLSEDIGKVILPPMDSFVPMPEVKPCKPEKDISEPVYAIVEAIRKYPSRFKVVFDKKLSENQDFSIFNVTDIKTGQNVIYSKYYFYGQRHRFSWQWLTKDEEEFLGEEGIKMHEKKLERKNALERAKMKGIYSAT